ncbi:hypothetical protein SEA_KEALII_34 [Arthrobacter phage KeAlii]|uniref:Uncharacterized protein n=1 Tax=Arthrobacter phage KeAlii TaxID=2885973 RepID=A0AA94X060_9CAUD|nr:hypothetical protein PQE15_gp34 [Arthrobacter phage KeAlii]UDL14640.1 hypothetical protein SEA_KEALII_34 [Arthrobacter phage KeAlii]
MSTPRVHIVHTTTEELVAERDAILREHPKLAEVDPSEFCCSGCVEHDIAAVYGYDAAEAWTRLQNLYFLLEDT